MKVKQNLSILIWAKCSKKNKQGLIPVYARITIDGKRAEISLNKKISIEKWDKDFGMLKTKDMESKAINQFLLQAKSDLNIHFINLCVLNEKVTTEMLSDTYLGKENKLKEKTLLDAFEYHNRKFKEKAEHGSVSMKTWARFEILKNKVIKFMNETYKEKDRNLSLVKHSFATEFEHYLMIKDNLATNTLMKYIKMLKTVLNMCVANEWIPSNPFANFKCTYTPPDRNVLTKEELLKLYEKEMPNKRLEEVRDVFMFACYTGYAFADLEKFEYNSVTIGIDGEYWLKTNRVKTDTSENVMILDIPMKIIEKYKSNEYCITYNKLLPIISNQRYNGYLKELAGLCNIKKHLTSHIARHTFATTVTLANGISLESVSAMLGHKSIRTTQIYAKVVQSKLSDEMKLLKEKLNPTIKCELVPLQVSNL
jgi:integrase